MPLRRILLVALAALAGTADAQTLSPRRHPFWALDVVVEASEPYERHSFGKLRAVMAALERAGRACRADTYARGVNIACGTGEERLLIDLEAIPTRYPDTLLVAEIRPRGPNGTPLPASEHIAFLNDFVRGPKHRPRRSGRRRRTVGLQGWSYLSGPRARIMPAAREAAMMTRIKAYLSFENEALAVAGLAFLFCGAVILGFL
jgi:hypothetical protein